MLQYGKEPKAKTEVKKHALGLRPKKPPISNKKFTPAVAAPKGLQVDKHRRILRELPERAEQRIANVQSRHEMLRAAEAQNLRIERDRVNSHLHNMPANLQRAAALQHVGDLTRKIHSLAKKGIP